MGIAKPNNPSTVGNVLGFTRIWMILGFLMGEDWRILKIESTYFTLMRPHVVVAFP